ncbi:hypothetical protein LX32DRAFT_87439 [Colletotrichum zoysiae]|uniref:Uncharacterized protein n=1 Tax=Colletotrichum zoysiae TaxID=1216348 RepID=A0AAD9HRX8_9PEZI|nr:hypothetical protein LX32DRAFT_87439 [Colletotrichum zoysiae]
MFNDKSSDGTTPKFMQEWIQFGTSVTSNPRSAPLIPEPGRVLEMLTAEVKPTTLKPSNHKDYKTIFAEMKAKKKVDRAKLWSVVLRLKGETEAKLGGRATRSGNMSVIDPMGRIARALSSWKEPSESDIDAYNKANAFTDSNPPKTTQQLPVTPANKKGLPDQQRRMPESPLDHKVMARVKGSLKRPSSSPTPDSSPSKRVTFDTKTTTPRDSKIQQQQEKGARIEKLQKKVTRGQAIFTNIDHVDSQKRDARGSGCHVSRNKTTRLVTGSN